MSPLYLCVALLFVIGSSANAQPGQTEKWRASVEVKSPGEFDKFLHLYSVKGTAGEYGKYITRPAMEWFVSTSIDKRSGARSHVLLFFNSYQAREWRYWASATTDDAQSLPVAALDRKVIDCSGLCDYSEIISIDLAERLLDERRDKGLKLRLRGNSGDAFVIVLTGDQISDQLAAARFYSAEIAPPPTSKPSPAKKGKK